MPSVRVGRLCDRGARGYTLVELLVVIAVLGVASALVIPSIGGSGVLRVQTAVRTVVADITFAQSDAIAYQRRRAIVFDLADDGDPSDNGYTVCEVNGETIDPALDALFDPDGPGDQYVVSLNDPKYSGATIEAAQFGGNAVLIFDELGGPVLTPLGNEPQGGAVTITGEGQTFDVSVEPYTGRVRVEREDPAGNDGGGDDPVGG